MVIILIQIVKQSRGARSDAAIVKTAVMAALKIGAVYASISIKWGYLIKMHF